MTTQPSLVAAQNICDRDIIAERWRQLKMWPALYHEDGAWDMLIRGWVDVLTQTATREFRRSALVSLAATAVACIEDLDNRSGDRAAVVEPLPIFTDQMGAQPA